MPLVPQPPAAHGSQSARRAPRPTTLASLDMPPAPPPAAVRVYSSSSTAEGGGRDAVSRPPTAPSALSRRALEPPALPPLLVAGGEGHVQRRYFFTERAHETERMPMQKHFDVMMQDAPPEQAADYIYCRYVDFLKEGSCPQASDIGLIDADTQSANVIRIAEWLRKARPRTRLDAAPMFVLAKQVIENLLDGDLAAAHRLREQAEVSRQEALAAHQASEVLHSEQIEQVRVAAVAREEKLHGELRAVEGKVAARVKEVDDLQRQVQGLQASGASCDALIVTLRKELSRGKAVEGVLNDDNQRLRQRVTSQDVALAAAAEAAAVAAEELETMQRRYRDERAAHSVLKIRHADMQASVEQAQLEHEQAQAEAAEAAEAADRQIRELRQEAGEAELQAAMSKHSAASATKHAGRGGGPAAAATVKALAVERELREALEEETEQLRSAHEELSQELGRMQRQHAELMAVEGSWAEKVQAAEEITGGGTGDRVAAPLSLAQWGTVQRCYRDALALRPECLDAHRALEDAVRQAKKLAAEARGKDAMQSDPPDWAGAVAAYEEAQGCFADAETDPELEQMLKLARMQLALQQLLGTRTRKSTAPPPSPSPQPPPASSKQQIEPAKQQARASSNSRPLSIAAAASVHSDGARSSSGGSGATAAANDGDLANSNSAATTSPTNIDETMSVVEAVAEAEEEQREEEQQELEPEQEEEEEEEEEEVKSTVKSQKRAQSIAMIDGVVDDLAWARAPLHKKASLKSTLSMSLFDAVSVTSRIPSGGGGGGSLARSSSTGQRWKASFIKSLCNSGSARPFAFGKMLEQCREAARLEPESEVLQHALGVAEAEYKRACQMLEQVQAQRRQLMEMEEVEQAQKKQAAADAAAAAAAAASSGKVTMIPQPEPIDVAAIEDVAKLRQLLDEAQQQRAEAAGRIAEAEREFQRRLSRLEAGNGDYEAAVATFRLGQADAVKRIDALKETLATHKQRLASATAQLQQLPEEMRAEARAERRKLTESFAATLSSLGQVMLLDRDLSDRVGRSLEVDELKQLLLLIAEGGDPLQAARTVLEASRETELARLRLAETQALADAAPPPSQDLATQVDESFQMHLRGLEPKPEPEPEPEPPAPKTRSKTVSTKQMLPTSPARVAYSPRTAGMVGPMNRESSCTWWAKAESPLQVSLTGEAMMWPREQLTQPMRRATTPRSLGPSRSHRSAMRTPNSGRRVVV